MTRNVTRKIFQLKIGRFIAYFLMANLTACKMGPDFHSPDPPDTDRYLQSSKPSKTVSSPGIGGQAQFLDYGEDIPESWWRLFHSEALNKLVEQGLLNSPDLIAGQAKLQEAQENLRAIKSIFLPVISANGLLDRQQTTLFSLGVLVPPGTPSAVPLTSLYNIYNTTVSVSYELDLFGGTQRKVEAIRSDVDYQKFELLATYLSLTGNIVTTAVTIASLRAQMDVIQHLIWVQEKQLKMIQNSVGLGHISKSEVFSKERELEETKASLWSLKNNLAREHHALSTLTGTLPTEDNASDFGLNSLKLPTHLPVSLPAELVKQRPDIQGAEALWHKASAEIGVATANLLPKFGLNANYGGAASVPSELFTPLSEIWSYGAQLAIPIFHGGDLMARRRVAIVRYNYAAAQYRKTMLSAFEDVANALRALEFDAQLLRAQKGSEISTLKQLTLIQDQYQLGKINYMILLDAEKQYDYARLNRIKAQTARYVDTAALFQALGGGWWNHS